MRSSGGRRRKVGLKRIDAAIDALTPFGFKKSHIRKTINDLLKVYGGDDGWPFIEEGSYKIVIEKIIEEQEEEPKLITYDKGKELDESWEDRGDMQDDMLADVKEKDGEASRTEGVNQIVAGVDLLKNASNEPKTEVAKVEVTRAVYAGNEPKTAAVKMEVVQAVSVATSWRDISFMLARSNTVGVGGDGIHRMRRRPPCHGYISESEEEKEPESPPVCTKAW